MIVCAGNTESFWFAKSIGVGLVDSAINLTKLLMNEKADHIVFIGTCGLYKNGKLLEVYESKNACNLEISQLLEQSYSPIFSSHDIKKLRNVSRETKLTNSSNFITTNKNISEKFAQIGFFMENMELYSVLEVANKFGIKAKGILCATNFCDENAHENFIKNHSKAKEKLEQYLIERKII